MNVANSALLVVSETLRGAAVARAFARVTTEDRVSDSTPIIDLVPGAGTNPGADTSAERRDVVGADDGRLSSLTHWTRGDTGWESRPLMICAVMVLWRRG